MMRMTAQRFVKFLAIGVAVCLGSSVTAAPAENRLPNIVFILADDLGWRDTSLYGSTFHETPHIDRLAQRGMMFTQAYAANPFCSPTRASILTGLYPGRVGITYPVCQVPEVRPQASLAASGPPQLKALELQSATRLLPKYTTLAEALREAGYATGHFGKWHLGAEPYDPLHRGFEVDVPHTPTWGPESGYLAPWSFWKGQGKPGEHIEDRMADEAVRFIREHRDRPFFLNYWAFSVHYPFDGKARLIEKYRKKVDPRNGQRCPVYAAMVESLDDAVGRLVQTLDTLGLSERTIIVFCSDNGGDVYDRVDGIPPTSNAPLRDGKGTLYEGGAREPCVVVWPGRVRPRSKTDAILSSVDFYPTLLEMIGLPPRRGQEFDGISQVPALLGKTPPRDTAYCFFPHYSTFSGNVAPGTWVRKGDWKLIRFHHDNVDQTDRFELYNLRNDLGETKNLAAGMPDKVKELDGLIARHLDEIHALVPKPNPAYRPTSPPKSGAVDGSSSKRWEPDIRAFEAADRSSPPPKDAILFIGSSTIRFWKTLAEDFPGHKVINRGFGGSQVADCTYYADRIVVPYQPRLIVLRAGGNDIHAGKTPEQVRDDFRAFVEKVRAELPKVRIAYITINASLARLANVEREKKANQLIKEYIATGENLDYIDTFDATMGPDGKPREELFIKDRLHFNAEGYKVLADVVRSQLKRESRADDRPPEVIIVNARVLTVCEAGPTAQALAVRGGRFSAVGTSDAIRRLAGPQTQTVDLRGKTVVPGFIDAHCHPGPVYYEGSPWYVVPCDPAHVKSLEDLLAALRRKAQRTPKGQWVFGARYQDTKLGRHPTRQDLDRASADHPILISHSSLHLAACNSAALAAAGVNRHTKDPPDGTFDRDTAGEPTGLLKEKAEAVVRAAASSARGPSKAEERAALRCCFRQFIRAGVTGVHVAGCSPEEARDLIAAAGEEGPLRLYIMLREDYIADVPRLKDKHKGDPAVKFGAVKFFHGNSVSGRTAWLSRAYADRPGYFGIPPARSQEALDRLVRHIHEAGLQACIHANGDREITMVLDAYERALAARPRSDHRHRIEHCSVVTEEILKRIRRLELVVAPHSYIYEHGDKLEPFGADRWEWMLPNHSLIDLGVVAAGNSDYPVSAAVPLLRIQDLVTRMSAEGNIYGATQRVTPQQSLRTWTLYGAYAGFAEAAQGSIEVGKVADFVVLGEDPTQVRPERIKDLSVEQTFIGGRRVWDRAGKDSPIAR